MFKMPLWAFFSLKIKIIILIKQRSLKKHSNPLKFKKNNKNKKELLCI